jgi:hypothetical protein
MSEQCFFTAGAIRAEEHFFGRVKETRGILGLLRRDQNVSVVGPRRIGKSSLLHHISRPTVFEAHHMSKTRHRFVYVNCCDLADSDASETRFRILQRAEQEIPEISFSLSSQAVSTEHFRQFLEKVERVGLRCIIMLDHFDSLVENPHLDHDFLESLRGMIAMHRTIYVVASTEPLDKLENKWISQRHQLSPFFNVFFYRQALGPFSQDESRAFLLQRFGIASLSVPGSVVDLIVSRTKGHPCYLQRAGAFTVRLLGDSQDRWNRHLTKLLQDHLVDVSENSDCYTM